MISGRVDVRYDRIIEQNCGERRRTCVGDKVNLESQYRGRSMRHISGKIM